MRFFAGLFACYLALLACLPCADAAPAAPAGVPTHLVATAPAPTGHACPDWCSPLCACSCCTATVLPPAAVVAFAPAATAPALSQRFARLAPPAVRQRAGRIWQPPQA